VTDSIDWQALFFDARADWPARLTARARRRFGDTPDAEAAYNFALDAISRDDWARLREKFRGSGTAEGFMAITFLNLLEEYAVRKYGRKRAPAWVQRMGGLWKRIFELLCLRRLDPERIVELLCARDPHEPAQVRSAIADVRGRIPGCGESLGEQTQEDAPEPEPVLATPASALEEGELRHLLHVLAGLFGRGADAPALLTEGTRQARARIAELEGSLSLTGEERLLLRLVYQENCTIPEAARSLRLNERTARRAHARVIERLRDALERHGFGTAHAAAVAE
jgi:hypothetical protein